MITAPVNRPATGPLVPALRHRPGIVAESVLLLSNLPLGIAAFAGSVGLLAVGLGAALFWVGLPVLAAALLLARGLARFERARAGLVLGVPVSAPERRLPAGWRRRWRVRITDPATWRALCWSVLLALPLGIVEFTVTVALWATGLALVSLPATYRFLPDGVFAFPAADGWWRWSVVDSVWSALPCAAGGVLVLAVAIVVSDRLCTAHARLALLVLGGRATTGGAR